jgi:hypothetical protein
VIAAVALLVVEEEGSEDGRDAEDVLEDAVVIQFRYINGSGE